MGLSGGEMGTSFFLHRAVGGPRAAEILLTGRTVEAIEAERIGLVSRLVDAESLFEAALETARLMVGKNPLGLRLTKESSVLNLTAQSLEAAIELENRAQSILSVAPEFVENIKTFSTRRKNRP